jgi:beta-phosphoglucomutase-like phosphatase (HAD superfamily)
MVTAFDVVQGKPFPEPYLKALSKSGLHPWEVAVVENAPLGVESAVAAGLFTIAVNTGPLESKVLKDSGANLVFDGGIKELFGIWEEFSKTTVKL